MKERSETNVLRKKVVPKVYQPKPEHTDSQSDKDLRQASGIDEQG